MPPLLATGWLRNRWSSRPIAGLSTLGLVALLTDLADRRSPLSVGAALGVTIAAGVTLAAAYRLALMGACPGSDSLTIRNFWRTHHIPWSNIERFSSRSEFVRGVIGIVELQDGGRVPMTGVSGGKVGFEPSIRRLDGMLRTLNAHLRSQTRT